LGVLSSDLRQHVVGHLIHPLFRWRDPRFELFVYIAGGQASDVAQDWFAAQSTRFVRLPADDRAAAEIIAADDLDLLLDVGGPTSSNQPGVLAWKPARRQVSWLGYPHPLGVPTVDAILLDAPLTPQRRELLAEPALVLPHTWLSMSPAAFQAEPALRPELPVTRRGFLTFATANDPYKFSPELLRTWARIVAAVPNARFRLIRYEASAPALQQNIARHFAMEGVGPERLEFPAIAGNARALYDDVDIALDTFPMAGGMTTCEALWMGVPTVTLAGPQVFERLGASILMAAGLPGLVTATVAEYERTALRLAAEIEGLTELRRTLRARLAAQPIGQPERFAADFYATIARACN
jgi:predicted O-linked N-acetylglucosamine transferase (SPINDLY family)